jgi:hypothetical protein
MLQRSSMKWMHWMVSVAGTHRMKLMQTGIRQTISSFEEWLLTAKVNAVPNHCVCLYNVVIHIILTNVRRRRIGTPLRHSSIDESNNP